MIFLYFTKVKALREHTRVYLPALYIYILDRNEMNYVADIVEKVINFLVESKFPIFCFFFGIPSVGFNLSLMLLQSSAPKV